MIFFVITRWIINEFEKYKALYSSHSYNCKGNGTFPENLVYIFKSFLGQIQHLSKLLSCTLTTQTVYTAYLFWRCNIPSKVKHVSTLVVCGSCRLVDHMERNRIVVHSSDIQLDYFIKCGIYFVWSCNYLGWEVICEGNT